MKQSTKKAKKDVFDIDKLYANKYFKHRDYTGGIEGQ